MNDYEITRELKDNPLCAIVSKNGKDIFCKIIKINGEDIIVSGKFNGEAKKRTTRTIKKDKLRFIY